jgi:DnaJ-class molecular chaperone
LAKRDFYTVLGLPKSSTKDEIKKKYRELAKKYHPDLNKDDKNAEAKFREVSEAYEVLEDNEKRQRYDSYGHAGVEQNGGGDGGNPFGGGFGGFGGFGGQGGFHTAQGQINIEDLFDMFNQQMGGRDGPGKDVETKLRISFLEAVRGCSKDISYEYFIKEPTGAKGPGGRLQYQKVRKSKRMTVDIPAGVDNGLQMRLESKGAEGSQGFPAGDLYIQLEVDPDRERYFRREGTTLYVEVPVPFTTAILGGTVDVKTLDGVVTMKVPPGTQPGTQLAMKGKGVAVVAYSSKRGDQVVTLNVTMPTKLTTAQRKVLENFDSLGTMNHSSSSPTSSSSSASSSIPQETPSRVSAESEGGKQEVHSASSSDESTASSDSSIWGKLKDFVGMKTQGAVTPPS